MNRSQSSINRNAKKAMCVLGIISACALLAFLFNSDGKTKQNTVTDPSQIKLEAGYFRVPFSLLKGKKLESIPEQVTALDGEKAALEGFMVPLDWKSRKGMTHFLLVGDRMSCCFGTAPPAHGTVFATMKGDQTALYTSYGPVTVYGTFEVDQNEAMIGTKSFYSMRVERIDYGSSLKPWWKFW